MGEENSAGSHSVIISLANTGTVSINKSSIKVILDVVDIPTLEEESLSWKLSLRYLPLINLSR